MKTKISFVLFWISVIFFGTLFASVVVDVDPYMHYHAPKEDKYFYTFQNARKINDGIIKHFDYDAMIIGTSMTENFKTSEFDKLYGVNSIKVCFDGASYKEINNNLETAVKSQPDLKLVVRALDCNKILQDKDHMRLDLGSYPTYLYDSLLINDYPYVLNVEIFKKAYSMKKDAENEYFSPGRTSFDMYSQWNTKRTYGKNKIIDEGIPQMEDNVEFAHLSKEDEKMIRDNINQNIIELVKDNPDISFYLFFTPYSVASWYDLYCEGNIYRQFEAEKMVIEMLLECENISLFSFNTCFDLTTDFNNYRDKLHYSGWVNTQILVWMKDGYNRLTKDNYQDYLAVEEDFYINFDYSHMLDQPDYEADFYPEALTNYSIWGIEPIDFGDRNNTDGFECSVDDITDYKFLIFEAKKEDNCNSTVLVSAYNSDKSVDIVSESIDSEWHQYTIDVSSLSGYADIHFFCQPNDDVDEAEGQYSFRNVVLY